MAQLTMLSSMADSDFETALQKHRDWGIEHLDLRDAIFGKRLIGLTPGEAAEAKRLIDAAGLKVYCFSPAMFLQDIANGEEALRQHLSQLDTLLPHAEVLQPKLIRVLGAGLSTREEGKSSIETISERYPWVIDVYREAVDRIEGAGFTPTIENEAKGCFLRDPEEFHAFFELLDRESVQLTWDIQNNWASGRYPSLEVYRELKPYLGYVHAKGGRSDTPGGRTLDWNVALEEASWPVLEIIQAVVDDGLSPIVCLNPPQHGRNIEGYDYSAVAKRDLDYLRANIKGIS